MPLKTMCSTKWEMPLISSGLAAGAGLDPDTHGDGAEVFHALGENDQAVGQYGTAKVSLIGHRHSVVYDCRRQGIGIRRPSVRRPRLNAKD